MAIFSIDAMEYDAHLGFYDEERSKPQKIRVSLKIYFSSLPLCAVDDHAHFIDYQALVELLGVRITSQPFRLIEFMAHTLFQDALAYVRTHGDIDACLWLKLTKLAPPITGLKQGASFEISNLISE